MTTMTAPDAMHEAASECGGGDTPDVASSTRAYAGRFAGPAGAMLLARQNALAARAVASVMRGEAGTVLDVGGGHAQLIEPMRGLGLGVTVLGSDASCRVLADEAVGAEAYTFVEGDLYEPAAHGVFDVVLGFRMLAHVADPAAFVAGLCGAARRAVVVDFATPVSCNALTALPGVFKAKASADLDDGGGAATRAFAMQRTGEVKRLFAANGWRVVSVPGQFFWPMAVHRKLGRPGVSRVLEGAAACVGLRALLGSPRVALAVRVESGGA